MTEADRIVLIGAGAIIIFFLSMIFFSSNSEDVKKEACYRNGYTRVMGHQCYGFEDTFNVDADYLIWKEKNGKD